VRRVHLECVQWSLGCLRRRGSRMLNPDYECGLNMDEDEALSDVFRW